jgi:hypothetical protein
MPGVAVHLDRPPRSGFLVQWGRGAHIWWGCVQFRIAVSTKDGGGELAVAAWIPAPSLTRPGWSSAAVDLPRLALPDDQSSWPAPPGWPSWYAGVWPNGPLLLPPGVEAATGPVWRRR